MEGLDFLERVFELNKFHLGDGKDLLSSHRNNNKRNRSQQITGKKNIAGKQQDTRKHRSERTCRGQRK